MFKKIAMSLLMSASVFAGSFDFYTNTSRIYFDVIPTIPEMAGLYNSAPDGGISYIMSEASGKEYCWLKTIDSNGVSLVRKFYVDWTNGKYTPETYGRIWNDMCKVSKRKKKFVDTDSIIQHRLTFNPFNLKDDARVVYIGRYKELSDFYYVETNRSGSGGRVFTSKVGNVEIVTTSNAINAKLIVLGVSTVSIEHITTIIYPKAYLCNGEPVDIEFSYYRTLSGVFLRRLIADGFLMISCDE